jgi:hypothetical protein
MRNAAWELLGRLALLAAVAMLIVSCNSSAAPLAASPTRALIAASATTGSLTSTRMPTLEPATVTRTVLPPTGTAPAATGTALAGSTATGTPHPAVTAILAYLQARAQTDLGAATALSCKAWKPQAVTEAISFRSMNARLVGVACEVMGSAGVFTLVGCRGKIVTTYGTESRDWDLSAFVYQVTTEDGHWKMCGYH